MMRYRILASIATVIAMSCTGCGEDEPPRGAAAMNGACDGVLDGEVVKQAKRSNDFSRIYNSSASEESHAAASKTMLTEDHVVYVCRLVVDDGSKSGNDALWIRFTPGLDPLFPGEQDRSYGFFDAYKLGSGMQATNKSRSTDIFFPCVRNEQSAPLSVTGTLFNDLNISTEVRFRTLFNSAAKMAHFLKCTNTIKFPPPEAMKPLPKNY